MTLSTIPRGSKEADADRPLQAVQFAVSFMGDHVRVVCEQCSTTWDTYGSGAFTAVTERLAQHAHRCVDGIPLELPRSDA